jgi:phosphoglycolate phosphatase-like HAD superfamily hydrolase
VVDLVGLVEDVEHVILEFDGRACSQWAEVFAAAQRSERELSLVGGDSRRAVEAQLADLGVRQYFAAIEPLEAKGHGDPSGVTQDSRRLVAAVEGYAARHGGELGAARRASVFVSGSLTGVQGAGAAEVRCIGLADCADERRRFEEAGASAVVASIRELVDALNARWDAQWCSRQYCC